MSMPKGTKLTDTPKNYMMRTRMDSQTVETLQALCEDRQQNQSETIRSCIRMVSAATPRRNLHQEEIKMNNKGTPFSLEDYKQMLKEQDALHTESIASINKVQDNAHYWGWSDKQIKDYVDALKPHLEKNEALILLCKTKIEKMEGKI